MRCCRPIQLLVALALVLSLPSLSAQQHEQQHEMTTPPAPTRKVEPIPLYTVGLGPFTRPISSRNAEAQAYFTQGFQMMYAFAKMEAVRSFREATLRDPNCAICFWGEAWAWGSYLNGPMSAADSPMAYAAIQKAISLKAHATEKERAFIDAMSVRYVEKFDSAKRVDQDRAYAEAMRKLSERYRDDLDAATLYGDALFLLEPRRGTRDLNSPSVKKLHSVLEGVLRKDIKHPGACHLYVHATESTTAPGKAEPCSEFLGDSIPGASHINHMPSHTWNEIGRWGDSVRANLQAWHSDLKAAIGEGFAIYPEHNLHMLAFAASMDGQGAVAIQAGKDYAKRTNDTIYHVLTLVRFGRFDEIAAVTQRPKAEVSGGIWDFAQGYALLRTKGPAEARPELDKVLKTAASSKAMFRGHPAQRILGTLGGILEGEVLLKEGDVSKAIDALERAVKLEDEIEYDEPEPLPFSARHWLGAALLEAKRPGDAEKVYREALADHPNNGWSLMGLKQALAAQGKKTTDVERELEKSWARSDTWLRASKF
jgi:tetratricopeptide (TPR) repeat protein